LKGDKMKNSLKKRCILYDDSKEKDIVNNPKKFKNLKGFIVNNWTPTDRLVTRTLKSKNVQNIYYKINVFDKTIAAIKKRITKAKQLGFTGIAIDGEAYSDSKIWSTLSKQQAKNFGMSIRTAIDSSCLETILLPEYLGMEDKYKNYEPFIDGLCPRKILMERTYNEWYPWKLIMFWNRNKKYYGEKCIGIWQDEVPWYGRWIQRTTAKLLSSTIFWYTQEKI